MAVAGSLTYDTKIDRNGFEKGLNSLTSSVKNSGAKIKNIVAALGIGKIVSATANTIKSSISSAMDRIDTMNQFTRVMTVMTGSANSANEALESIKKTVTGTAYGLDIASKSTQKLVTSGMDLKKSTKQIQTWADAIAFYSDGTNATFENVTDALSKMVAKGKVEMDQLNRLTDSGIPAVQIYADMVGKSVSEVQDDLSKGRISAEDFLEGLDRAFNNGTNKFASITGAAKKAGSSWKATFDNFKAAITRGMTNIISSIDEGLKSIGLKSIREAITDIGKKAEEIINKIAKKLPDLLRTLKNLTPVIIGGTTAFIAFKSAMAISSIIETVKTALNGATIAQYALNLAMSLNPAGIVMVAIIALIAALYALVQALGGPKEAFKKLREFIDGCKKAIQEFLEKIQFNEKLEKIKEKIGQLNEKLKGLKDLFKILGVIFAVSVVPTIILISGLIGGITNAIEPFMEYIGSLIDILSGLGEIIVGIFTLDGEKILGGLKQTFNGLVEYIIAPFKMAWSFLTGFSEGIGALFETLFGGLIQNIKTFFTETIPNTFHSFIDFISQIPQKIWEFLVNGWNWVTTELPQIIQSVIDWFAQLPRRDLEMAM